MKRTHVRLNLIGECLLCGRRPSYRGVWIDPDTKENHIAYDLCEDHSPIKNPLIAQAAESMIMIKLAAMN